MEYKMKPAYKGYKAYEYLEEGKDFPKFEWADWDWAGRHVVELEPGRRLVLRSCWQNIPMSVSMIIRLCSRRTLPASRISTM